MLGLQRAGTARQRICRNEKCVCRPELKGRNYIDRLKVCKLPTLHYRRIRGDMIETYKIVSGKYDNLAAPMLPSPHSHVTQGHDLRLKKNRARYDLRKCKFFFTNRVVNIWNSLPDYSRLILMSDAFMWILARHLIWSATILFYRNW